VSRWLRINEDCIDNPKILKLPEALRWQWVALLCVASKNDGVLPPIDDVALCLRVPEAKAAEFITKLVKARLIDKEGDSFVPHNWTKRQFKSDSSTERGKRHRDKHRNVSLTVTGNVSSTVSETVTVTPPEQSRAETESEQNTADARALDEMGLKNEKALSALFTALCLSLNRSPPDMRPITAWLLDGIPMGTISTIVTPILKRKADMASLSYCDAAVREAHARLPSASLQIVSRKVFVVEGTIEWGAQQRHARETTGRGTPIVDEKDLDGRLTGRRGWYFESLVPEGYDEATGERIAPTDDEAAA
jgi:hypothetical protein